MGYKVQQHEHIITLFPIDNPKMLAEKHNDEKLAFTILIIGIGIIAYHFW